MMPFMLLAGAAATLTPAELRSVGISDQHYPTDAISRGQQGNVGVHVTVDPKGKAIGCRLSQPSGVRSLDLMTCAAVLEASRFRPAQDLDGKATYGLVYVPFAWRLPGRADNTSPIHEEPDYEMSARLRDTALSKSLTVTVVTLVDEVGALRACSATPQEERPELVEAACGALPNVWTPMTLMSADHRPVRYVRTVRVAFVPELAG